ncbi:Collectin-11 [Bagarius yarrelli]|uniref:Collectin-11 n=1 Tax=Bagarius yarrelli TaxID=175774 RepID=A0A556TUP7_BAGYA|nr:Collectin-11 [Bagarius yarrelli]
MEDGMQQSRFTAHKKVLRCRRHGASGKRVFHNAIRCKLVFLLLSTGDPGKVGEAGDEGRLGKTGPPGHTGLYDIISFLIHMQSLFQGLKRVLGESGEKGDAGRTGKPGPAGERVILGVKEMKEKFYLLVKEERNHGDAQINCRLRGGTLALAEHQNISTLLGSYISEAGLTHVLVRTTGEPEHGGNSTVSGSRCTQVASDGELSWVECHTQKFYICEFLKN